jgi:hypothetical protein
VQHIRVLQQPVATQFPLPSQCAAPPMLHTQQSQVPSATGHATPDPVFVF